MANYEHGRLIILQNSDVTEISGITDASPDLMAVVGTVKEASLIRLDNAEGLERALVKAAQSGKKVMDGYIKFAAPIQIMQGSHVMAKEAAGITVDDLGLREFIAQVTQLTPEDTDGIEKLAACDFVQNWIDKVELDKVDGKEVGLTAPVKVAFSDDKAKDWFLSLFNKKADEEKAASATLAERLVAAGVKKADAVERMARVMSKHGQRKT